MQTIGKKRQRTDQEDGDQGEDGHVNKKTKHVIVPTPHPNQILGDKIKNCTGCVQCLLGVYYYPNGLDVGTLVAKSCDMMGINCIADELYDDDEKVGDVTCLKCRGLNCCESATRYLCDTCMNNYSDYRKEKKCVVCKNTFCYYGDDTPDRDNSCGYKCKECKAYVCYDCEKRNPCPHNVY